MKVEGRTRKVSEEARASVLNFPRGYPGAVGLPGMVSFGTRDFKLVTHGPNMSV